MLYLISDGLNGEKRVRGERLQMDRRTPASALIAQVKGARACKFLFASQVSHMRRSWPANWGLCHENWLQCGHCPLQREYIFLGFNIYMK
jgi:hypothetical protein